MFKAARIFHEIASAASQPRNDETTVIARSAATKQSRCIFSDQRGSLPLGESIALKVVSLLLALILWITILGLKQEQIKVPVKFEPLVAPGMMITSKIPSHIEFVFSGPRVLLNGIENKIPPIRPDLRRTQERTIPLTISEDLVGELPKNVSVISFNPNNLLIRLEEVVERYIPIKPTLGGIPADGYEIANVAVSPARVPVLGPKSILDTMDYVDTEIFEIHGIKGSKSGLVAVELSSTEGLRLSRERMVRIEVSVKKISGQGRESP